MDAAIRAEVATRLDRIETDEDVRVLFACESGSRAWGFASADSDYDVRFVYVHPRDWYLAVFPERRRDVIELPIEDAVWDVNGWDLPKTLRLFAKSNPPLLEWLSSPIVYREPSPLAARLRALLPLFYSPRACHLHYHSMARGNYREYLKGDTVWRKKYLYLLRPLLACRWIERDQGPAPMEFDTLLAHTDVDATTAAAIARLLAEKRAGAELGRGPADPVLNAWIETEFARHDTSTAPTVTPRGDPEQLNDLFREMFDAGSA